MTEEQKVEFQARINQAHRERVDRTLQNDPLVKVSLKGNDYILELNNSCVKGIYKDCGMNLLSDTFDTRVMQDPEKMGCLLYWALKIHHPTMTQEDADNLISYRFFPYISVKLREVVSMFMPDLSDIKPPAEEEEEKQATDPI